MTGCPGAAGGRGQRPGGLSLQGGHTQLQGPGVDNIPHRSSGAFTGFWSFYRQNFKTLCLVYFLGRLMLMNHYVVDIVHIIYTLLSGVQNLVCTGPYIRLNSRSHPLLRLSHSFTITMMNLVRLNNSNLLDLRL